MRSDLGKLTVTINPGDIVTIGNVILTFEHRRGSQMRLKIAAPKDMKIHRHHLKKGSNAAGDKIQDQCDREAPSFNAPRVVHETPAGIKTRGTGLASVRVREVRSVGAEGSE